jgi:hypothetical protein
MTAMDIFFKNKLSLWHQKAKKEKDPWVKFVLYYLIFDAYTTKYSGSNNDAGKLDWFLGSNNSLRDSIAGSWKSKLLPMAQALKALSPVSDMRPRPVESVALEDVESYEEIFKFIYQIRCNLFHGSKDLQDSRDKNLVHFGGKFLEAMIDWWMSTLSRNQ